MMRWIKQSEATAARKVVAFFLVDATDGFTPEPGVTISAGELKVRKAGGAFVNAAGTWTEVAEGLYDYIPTAAEVDTPGLLCVKLVKTGIRTNPALVEVVVHDPYAAPNPRAAVSASGSNTASTFLTTLTAATNDFYRGPMLLHFTSGTLAGQTRPLLATSAYNGATKFITVSPAFTAAPTAADEFELIAR